MPKSGTDAPSVSVAVLSHRRPHLLGRVLRGVDHLEHPNFEVVVVGDQEHISGYGLPARIASQVRYVHYPEPNICRARNLAVAASAGEFIAFLDDDAVPEPDWLTELLRGFMFPEVGAVGGLVRAADGLTVEWEGGVFDRAAVERPMQFPDDVRAFDADSQVIGNEFVGTMGANSAFRREAVLSVGGFDEAIHYYLDETDLMLRLAEAGWHSGLARTAEVHHLREENHARTPLRVPRNLFEIAASKAYFCKRHLDEEQVLPALQEFRRQRRLELDPYLRLGVLRRADRDRLMQQVEAGIADGLARDRKLADRAARLPVRFQRYAPARAQGALRIAIASSWGFRSIRRTRQLARRFADMGHSVSLFSFFSGQRPQDVRFQNGLWLHRGGTWRWDQSAEGRRVFLRSARVQAEMARIAGRRRFDVTLLPGPGGTAGEGSGLAIQMAGGDVPLWARVPDGMPHTLQEIMERLEADLRQSGGHAATTAPAQADHEAPVERR